MSFVHEKKRFILLILVGLAFLLLMPSVKAEVILSALKTSDAVFDEMKEFEENHLQFGAVVYKPTLQEQIEALQDEEAHMAVLSAYCGKYCVDNVSNTTMMIIPNIQASFHFLMRIEDASLITAINRLISIYLADGMAEDTFRQALQYTQNGILSETFNQNDTENFPALKIGITGQMPPYDYIDLNGDFAGFCINYIRTLAHDMEYNATFTQLSPAVLYEELISGTVDLVFWCYTPLRYPDNILVSDMFFKDDCCLVLFIDEEDDDW